jgi:hypothetical protein
VYWGVARWASFNALIAEKVSATCTPHPSIHTTRLFYINVVVVKRLVRYIAKFAWLERNADIKEDRDI